MFDSANEELDSLLLQISGRENIEYLKTNLLKFDRYNIDETVVHKTDRFLSLFHQGLTKIATTNVLRRPRKGEWVAIFGAFGYGFENLVVNNPARRNLLEFETLRSNFDTFESDRCWQHLDRIFIINRDDRRDRLFSCLRELGRMGAPLDKIERISASVYDSSLSKYVNGTIGCLKSHLFAINNSIKCGYNNVMILEDDYCFVDDISKNQECLDDFFLRNYNFDICLLATSKSGLLEAKDDLVSITRQECTNTSAYILSRRGSGRLSRCYSAALENLIATGDHGTYAADRCWAVLQGDRFLVFRRRLGFQAPSFSDIENRVTEFLD